MGSWGGCLIFMQDCCWGVASPISPNFLGFLMLGLTCPSISPFHCNPFLSFPDFPVSVGLGATRGLPVSLSHNGAPSPHRSGLRRNDRIM